MDRDDSDETSARRREIGIWIAAAADVGIGFLVAMFGDALFGIGQQTSWFLGLAIAAASVTCALVMTSDRRKADGGR